MANKMIINKIKPDNTDLRLRNRYIQLDSLRGIASLSVFFWHSLYLTNYQHYTFSKSFFPFIGFFWNGHAAVIFFFLLSGFVLSLPYMAGLKALNLIDFYVRRIIRIYPTLIVVTILFIVLKFAFFDTGIYKRIDWIIPDFWNWKLNRQSVFEIIKTDSLISSSFNSNFFIPPIWTLAVEMQMSIILPFFIVIINRFNVTFNILFAVLFFYLTRESNFVSYFGVFYCGILLAKYKYQIYDYIIPIEKYIYYLLWIIALVFYNSNLLFFAHLKGFDLRKNERLVTYTTLIGCISIMLLALYKTGFIKFLSNSFFTFLGELSYSFYLIHMPTIFIVLSVFSNHISNPFFLILICLLVSVLLSYIINKYFEQPIQTFFKQRIKKIKFPNFAILN